METFNVVCAYYCRLIVSYILYIQMKSKLIITDLYHGLDFFFDLVIEYINQQLPWFLSGVGEL